MYKARKSKYFSQRYEGVVCKVTKNYIYAKIVNLDDNDDKQCEIRLFRQLFKELPKIKTGTFFNMYFKTKNKGIPKVIIELKKFRPVSEREIEKEANDILKLCNRSHLVNCGEKMKRSLLLCYLLCICLNCIGCFEGDIQIVRSPVAEVDETNSEGKYDESQMKKINIPKNCKIVAFDNNYLLIENSSGTQFFFKPPTGGTMGNTKIVPCMPELW